MEDIFAPAPETTNKIPAIITAELLSALRDHGVINAELFGSAAHGADTPDRDIDLLVTFAQPVSPFDQSWLADELRCISGRPVDLLTAIPPAFGPHIVPPLVPLSLRNCVTR